MSSEACFAGGGRLPGDASTPTWCDHELWLQAGSGVRTAAASERTIPAVPPQEWPGRDPAARQRCRRDIGRSLFRTFDSARRRCGRGARIRLL